MAIKHKGEEKALIKLEGTVDECCADTASTLATAREVRDIVIERVGRRSGRRPTRPAARATARARAAHRRRAPTIAAASVRTFSR